MVSKFEVNMRFPWALVSYRIRNEALGFDFFRLTKELWR